MSRSFPEFLMNRVVTRLGFTAIALVAGATVAHAQSTTSGSVSGVVADEKGSPLAGATVTFTSTQGSRATVSATDGSYRMPLLNPGAWSISVSKDGYQTQKGSVNVSVNETLTVPFKLAPAAGATVVVSASAATVDLTSTTQGLTTSLDTIAAVPKGRDFSSLAFFSPGVVTSGFGDPSIGGGSGAENSYIVDGLTTTDFRRGFQGAALVTDFIEQVEIQTGGFRPEFSALGGVFNAVTKTGGNEFRGSSWFTIDPVDLAAKAVRNQYFRQPSPYDRYDVGAEVSGPILKDKLFYFVGLDAQFQKSQASLPNNNGLTSDNNKITTIQFLGKINWNINNDNKLAFTVNANDNKDDWKTIYPTTGDANLGRNIKNKTLNLVLNYDWTITPSLLLSLKAGTTQYKDSQDPVDNRVAVTDAFWFGAGPGSVPGGNPAGLAPTTGYRRGGLGFYEKNSENTTTQYQADLSWFLGTHSLKFGIGLLESKYSLVNATTGGYRVTVRTSGGVNTEDLSTNATVKAVYTSLYLQDQWEMFAGFKLMYGARYEAQDQQDLNGKSFLKYSKLTDVLQPRIGFTWDLNNDGKSKVSGSYGVYFEKIPQRVAIRVFANEIFLRRRYTAGQANYAGVQGTNPNIYNNWSFLRGVAPGSVPAIQDFATPFSFDPIAENTKLPQRREWTLGFDKTIADGWTMGLHGKYRVLTNPIEDSVITDFAGNPYDLGAPTTPGNPASAGGQAILWNPGRFAAWTSTSLSVTPNQRFVVNNTLYGDNPGNNYRSLDFTLEKKTDRDLLNFSYTWSKLTGNYEGVVSSSNGQADGNITASFDYWPYVGDGLLPLDRTHVVKMFGSHRFTVFGNDLNVGFRYTYQSGTPVSLFDDGRSTFVKDPSGATVNPPDVGGYGNATPQDFTLGQFGRTPSTNLVDLHVDYSFKLGGRYRLLPSIDLFNVFNSRQITSVYQQATDQAANVDPRYGSANGWQSGRAVRFGVKVQF
jgi:Carboxypeptidase regulatory-like domain